MRPRALHQVLAAAGPGDAITDHALQLRRWLRELGFASDIYVEGGIEPERRPEVRRLSEYRPGGQPWLIYHHAVGSPAVERLVRLPPRLMVIYHNITPPEFFAGANPRLAQDMITGRLQLQALRPRTGLAVADSDYNAAELRAAGFGRVRVLPIALDEGRFQSPPDPAVLERWPGGGPRLLFVGRVVPSKKQEDLIKLLYFYRRFCLSAELIIVGDLGLHDYAAYLRRLARELRVEAAVHLVGKVSQAELLAYYRLADVYMSMSEHEGLGIPLIESMYLGVPVLAYAATAVPGTLGGAGVLFHHKHYEALAEVVDWLVRDQPARQRVLERQRQRAQDFLEPAVRSQWETALLGLFED